MNSSHKSRDRTAWDIWVRNIGASENVTARLFCLPCAGAGPSMFRSWVKHVQSGLQLCLVDLPGREGRMLEPPVNKMDVLVRHIQEAVLTRLDLPYLVFGHSMGAIVGYELVQSLVAAGLPSPVAFLPSGAAAPHCRQQIGVHDLPDEAFFDFLCRSAGTPRELFENPDLLELILPALRADFELTDSYVFRPRPRLTFPIVVFAGNHDPLADVEGLNAWHQHTHGEFRVHRPFGDHLYMRAEDQAFFSLLAGELERLLLRPG